MSVRLQAIIALAVGLAVLAAGAAYTFSRQASYESDGSLLLAPKPGVTPDIVSNLLQSFDTSGTSGTYTELITSNDTLAQAHVPGGIDVTVRAVPDSRVLQVTATGPTGDVQSALRAVIRTSIARESETGDVWQLQSLESPSAPSRAGPSKGVLLLATIVLALLAPLVVMVAVRRLRLGAPTAGGDAQLAAWSGVAPDALPLTDQDLPRVRFVLQSFRYVHASPTTALLLVAGYWRSEIARALAEPVMLLHDGRQMHPLAPVAAPDNREPTASLESPLWRASYAAPVEVFERHTRFALRAGSGAVVGLPHPTQQATLGLAPDVDSGNGRHPSDGESGRPLTAAPDDALESPGFGEEHANGMSGIEAERADEQPDGAATGGGADGAGEGSVDQPDARDAPEAGPSDVSPEGGGPDPDTQEPTPAP